MQTCLYRYINSCSILPYSAPRFACTIMKRDLFCLRTVASFRQTESASQLVNQCSTVFDSQHVPERGGGMSGSCRAGMTANGLQFRSKGAHSLWCALRHSFQMVLDFVLVSQVLAFLLRSHCHFVGFVTLREGLSLQKRFLRVSAMALPSASYHNSSSAFHAWDTLPLT